MYPQKAQVYGFIRHTMGLADDGEGVAGEPALVGLGELRAQYRRDTGKVRCRVGVAAFGYAPLAIHLFVTGRTATGGASQSVRLRRPRGVISKARDGRALHPAVL